MNFANVLEKREFKNENVNKVTQMLKKMTWLPFWGVWQIKGWMGLNLQSCL